MGTCVGRRKYREHGYEVPSLLKEEARVIIIMQSVHQ